MLIEQTVGVVTGGGGGLGGAVVTMLAEGGGQAAILDLPSSPGATLAESLGEAALFVPTDVTRPDQVEAAFTTVLDRFGRVDLTVNAAGVSPAHRVLTRDRVPFPLDLFRTTVEVNLLGTFDVVRHAARAMSANEPGEDDERGLIVNVASIAGMEGQVGQAAYAASKGGVVALTLPLARDLAAWGIRVMTIAPGIMDTPMLAGLDERRRAALVDLNVFPKRLGTPDDFAKLVRGFMENTMLNGDVARLDAATRLA
ncbi:SDR family NAD(P)-dependent oxidoreductase [Actinophytocola oryzae]|uniref:NAD(P)-dependent dehydrogenase (Short-subunit alcohol dehydrogenase family) n=1 Tax=Actinophytocola oryzae TaxID=502181 RepID=A0A4V3FUR5_9PSEU|nr:SDR family NAD(P)-dependent oxidoreductase [Actinophytocola oryzae]TDV56221.1 NAD(P)-dependent dehydrogenase (short-subunit alcohol dehydrogenase family) [Actinophytocola oryzae]